MEIRLYDFFEMIISDCICVQWGRPTSSKGPRNAHARHREMRETGLYQTDLFLVLPRCGSFGQEIHSLDILSFDGILKHISFLPDLSNQDSSYPPR